MSFDSGFLQGNFVESLWMMARISMTTLSPSSGNGCRFDSRKDKIWRSIANHNKVSTIQGYPFLVGRQRLPWVSVERPTVEQSILGRMEVIVVYPECALFIDTGRRYSLQSMTGHELHAKRSLSGNATDDLVDLRIVQGSRAKLCSPLIRACNPTSSKYLPRRQLVLRWSARYSHIPQMPDDRWLSNVGEIDHVICPADSQKCMGVERY